MSLWWWGPREDGKRSLYSIGLSWKLVFFGVVFGIAMLAIEAILARFWP
jgi:hypothetical protein